MKTLKPFLIRFLTVAVPLLGIYIFAQIAANANRGREHPTDVGLGIAFLSVFTFLVLFVGFTVDLVIRVRRKQHSQVWMDSFFLFLFTIPIAYIICLITSRDCFCKWLIDTIDWIR